MTSIPRRAADDAPFSTAVSPAHHQPKYRLIQPPSVPRPFDPFELWGYRRLVWLMMWRDFRVRFMQSVFGGLWVIIQPLFNVVFCTFIFNLVAKMPSDGVPYYLFNYTATIPWLIFNQALANSAGSLVAHASLLQKVHFPRLVLPIYGALSYIPDLLLMLSLQFVIIAFWGFLPSKRWIVLPFYFAWLFVLIVAVGILLAGLNARYRDVGHGLTFGFQLWYYITPIAIPTASLPFPVRLLGETNPLTPIFNGMRWAILRTDTPPRPSIIIPLGLTALLLAVAVRIFRRSEATLADVV